MTKDHLRLVTDPIQETKLALERELLIAELRRDVILEKLSNLALRNLHDE